jgi:hypothetical protein
MDLGCAMKHRFPTTFILLLALVAQEVIACFVVAASLPPELAPPPSRTLPFLSQSMALTLGAPGLLFASGPQSVPTAAAIPLGATAHDTPFVADSSVFDAPLQCRAVPLPAQSPALPELGANLLKVTPLGASASRAGGTSALLACLPIAHPSAVTTQWKTTRRPLIGIFPTIFIPPG